jgi:hypothetical protein
LNEKPGFFKRYREAVNFNRNIIVAGLGAFFTGALVAQLYAGYDENDLANSALTLAAEYSVYIPVFAFLYYWDNRSRYVDPATGKKDARKIRTDIKKLLATFSVSEVVFSLVKIGMQYWLLQTGTEAYASAMAASIVAWAVFFVLVNYMAKLVRLFRH